MQPSTLTTPAPHRFTREEYHRMGKAGLFREERVELEVLSLPEGQSLAIVDILPPF